MTAYISHLDLHNDDADEQKLQSEGFMKINVDLNKEAGGKATYLWYKKGSCPAPITRIQLTFNVQMSVGLIKAGYTKVHKPVNHAEGVDPIYLWFYQGSTEYDTPIVAIDVTSEAEKEAQKFRHGWEKLACDLNRNAGGDWVYIWVKRENPTYICDVAVTDSFTSDEMYFCDSYIRVDEDAHRGTGSDNVFIWYRLTTNWEHALSDLKVSTTESEFQALQGQNYQPLGFNFNQWTGSIYLWYKRERSSSPIKTITLLLNIAAVPVYIKAGVTVIEKNLNTGNKGRTEYLCFYK
ncbi:uncharacterized protein [Cebidichthys violaceus]|uniref:uncharacterized protein n=1 Tax=Cebidichthys violaceus TaxID=271503 RepID=UPI0035CAD4CD